MGKHWRIIIKKLESEEHFTLRKYYVPGVHEKNNTTASLAEHLVFSE